MAAQLTAPEIFCVAAAAAEHLLQAAQHQALAPAALAETEQHHPFPAAVFLTQAAVVADQMTGTQTKLLLPVELAAAVLAERELPQARL
jgi:hypothetical protein